MPRIHRSVATVLRSLNASKQQMNFTLRLPVLLMMAALTR
jgi:hypothetical protein